ncbi:hypothetical protein V9W64_10725 [Neisseria leonii]|uniref:Uncharacterized protein n=1 Tax=Neisseria leonii TaxID=2995413 RepID=A0A9X4E836_9NEIS|nr:hypothetical protein [Neisseria sp. 51.81]MDD9328802.1 hypothetical protein [Neisseria sp. 51.81]
MICNCDYRNRIRRLDCDGQPYLALIDIAQTRGFDRAWVKAFKGNRLHIGRVIYGLADDVLDALYRSRRPHPCLIEWIRNLSNPAYETDPSGEPDIISNILSELQILQDKILTIQKEQQRARRPTRAACCAQFEPYY